MFRASSLEALDPQHPLSEHHDAEFNASRSYYSRTGTCCGDDKMLRQNPSIEGVPKPDLYTLHLLSQSVSLIPDPRLLNPEA